MPGHYCLLCASDDGVFLDITPDNLNAFNDQIKACLDIKINDILDLSNKICYKCAYELDQCAKFVEKYKKSREQEAKEDQTSKPCCFLCYELVDKDRIFDLTKDKNVLFNPLRKIRNIFSNDAIKKNNEPKLICLTCRYNLDVLYDLKRIYRETLSNLKALIDEEINYSNFPKVHTDVVNRKTTLTTFSDITFYGSITSDSDSNEQNMARSKRSVKGSRKKAQIKLRDNKTKTRNCDNCHNIVANGIDMYRFYHTGLTVCKNCWITIDPNDKSQRRGRQMQSNLAETKLCAVFLTDVLSKESGKEKIHEKKNKDNNTSYSSSQEETKSSESSPRSVSSKTMNYIVNGKTKQGKKRRLYIEESKEDVEHTPLKMTKLSQEGAHASEIKSTRASIDSEQSSTQSLKNRIHSKRTIDKSSDSDSSVDRRETRSRNKLNDRVNKPSRKKQKLQSEEKTPLSARSDSSEISNEEGSLKRKTRGATRLSSATLAKSKKDKAFISRTSSSSRSSTEMTPTKFKSPQSSAQSESKTEFSCDLCDMKFSTKSSNTKHKLTHLKQAALKLEKLPIETIKEDSEAEVDSQDKISKEVTLCPKKSASSDKHVDNSSEDIAINVEDDTDEETLRLSSKESTEEKTEKEKNDESGDIIDKPDVSESRVKESANDENVEVKESEQCKESTVVSEGAEKIDDEDSRNKNIRNEHTADDKTSADSDNSKDKDAQETVVTVSEEKNVDGKEDKDVDVENETEVCSTEEKTINERNKDEEVLQEEIVHDRETSSSPILLTCKKSKSKENYNKSCKNNLESNTDDKFVLIEELIEEPETIQLDEEKIQENMSMLMSHNETEILSDNERNSNDIIIINEDKAEKNQHNRSNEENIEVNIIADSDMIADPDLSNGEKFDEIKDGDKADVMVASVNNDSIDDKVNHTEEMVSIDNSKDPTQLVDEINELEELVKDNALNNKHEVQENFACVSDNSSADAATEILKEVFDLAAAEVQQREESNNVKNLGDIEMETLENISREIRKSADMPSLDPINIMDMDDDNGITLN